MNERLNDFIANLSGIKREKITSESRLISDLGIYGDDAIELIIAYGKEFNVDVSNFMAADYFQGEGDTILPAIIRWILGKPKLIIKDFTVAYLEKGVLAGKLDEEVIGHNECDFMRINNSETEIVSHWIFDGHQMLTDEQGKRIDWLIHHYLKKIAADDSGWDILYQDPNDQRYWELTYPKSELQGGGPPMLTLISENESLIKYKL